MQSRERTLKKTINGVSVPQEDKDRAKEDYDKMKDTDIYKKYQEFKKKKKDVDKLRKRMKEKGSTEELEKKLTTAQEEANKVVR
jgi:capsular polysaccharide biosynthesis protein